MDINNNISLCVPNLVNFNYLNQIKIISFINFLFINISKTGKKVNDDWKYAVISHDKMMSMVTNNNNDTHVISALTHLIHVLPLFINHPQYRVKFVLIFTCTCMN